MGFNKILFFVAGAIAGVGLFFLFGIGDKSPNRKMALSDASEMPAKVEQSPLAVVSESVVSEASGTAFELLPDNQQVPPESSNIELIVDLAARIERAELRIDELETLIGSTTGTVRPAQEPPQPTPVVASRDELINAGFDPFLVDEIKAVRDDSQLQRLELRDRATREGWIDTDRFREESNNLRAENQLKAVLGEAEFDRLLIAEGRNNRVRVDSVIAGSAADLSGLQVNDIIYRYAEDRIFTFADLRRATSGGQRDEPVNLQIYRNDESVDLVVPRGPLGVTISGIQQ